MNWSCDENMTYNSSRLPMAACLISLFLFLIFIYGSAMYAFTMDVYGRGTGETIRIVEGFILVFLLITGLFFTVKICSRGMHL
jgi:hypothetical protein